MAEAIISIKGLGKVNYENIISYKDGAIGVIKINRSEIRNALNIQTVMEMEGALEIFENNDEVKAIVFTGEGNKAFAAGADINQLKERTSIEGLKLGLSGLCQKIESSSKVTLAAINGYALGGGCELALACDIRIASENAAIGLPELNLAIIPGAGGTQRLARIVGKGIALDMILTGEIISSFKAEKIGLVSLVVPQEQLWATVLGKVSKIINKGPLAIRLVKTVINQGFNADLSTALTLEKFAQSILLGTEDKEEGTTAFLQKRNPVFNGK